MISGPWCHVLCHHAIIIFLHQWRTASALPLGDLGPLPVANYVVEWEIADVRMLSVGQRYYVLEKRGARTGKNEWIAGWVWANACTSQMLTIDTIHYPNVCIVIKII